MRLSYKFFIKISVISISCVVLYASYNFYVYDETPTNKIPVESAKIENKIDGNFNGALQNLENRVYNLNTNKKFFLKRRSKTVQYPKHEIEIWGKASIAEYLWSHILDANFTTYANGLIKHGETVLRNLLFRFRSGPGIVQNTVPTNVKNLVLVLNGKDEIKVKFSKYWLDYLIHFKILKNVALVILGDEKCDNDWILPYLKSRGGVLNIVFVVYDSKLVDNREIFQWPLGVATYRGFPNIKLTHVNPNVSRRYLCSFLGTIYKNSSREILHNILKKSGKCFVAPRDTWIPVETYESMGRYIKTLTDSDLTLNPVGQNTECYRIYEALSLGSVPVVENVVTPGNCDNQNSAPLRILKDFKAPIIFIENWNDLNRILESENNLGLQQKIERRKIVLKWYDDFKVRLKNKFVELIKRNFFKEE